MADVSNTVFKLAEKEARQFTVVPPFGRVLGRTQIKTRPPPPPSP